MSHTLLFEIGTEELPAFYVDQGREGLGALLAERLNAARLSFKTLELFSTPRRLAARVSGLADVQPRLESRRRGPAARAGEQAAAGFAASLGLTPGDLEEEGGYLHAILVQPGRTTPEVLPELLAGVLRDLPAPRKMRWGTVTDAEFVRPVAWLVALLDTEVLPLTVAGVTAGRATRGHRFLSPGEIDLASPSEYETHLLTAHVVADQETRRELTLKLIREALPPGVTFDAPGGLVDEVVNLVEYPSALVGDFDLKYLALPDEVLAETMVVHQRYFPVRGAARLENKFVAVSNNRVPDPAVPLRGYTQVLEGRLSDAKFFWDHDVEVPLSRRREALGGRAFQKGLGSMLDKANRVRELASRLGERLLPDPAPLRQAAGLHLADLSTQMVGEYPDLAGVMGRAYAGREGTPPEVAGLLAEAVKPVTAEAELPASLEGALLSIVERTDTLVGFFGLGKPPSGSADPFGLRRTGIGLVRTLARFGIALPLSELIALSAGVYREAGVQLDAAKLAPLEDFLWDRLAALLGARGVPPQVIRAARGAARTPYGLLWRAALLHGAREDADFAELAALYKRAANLAGDTPAADLPAVTSGEAAERALAAALPGLKTASAALEEAARRAYPAWDPQEALPAPQGDLGDPLRAVTRVKPVLDSFFDQVMVMVEDENVRTARLQLLAGVKAAVRRLAALEELA